MKSKFVVVDGYQTVYETPAAWELWDTSLGDGVIGLRIKRWSKNIILFPQTQGEMVAAYALCERDEVKFGWRTWYVHQVTYTGIIFRPGTFLFPVGEEVKSFYLDTAEKFHLVRRYSL